MSEQYEAPSMGIDPYERAWMIISIILLGAFTVAIAVAGFAGGIQVPSPEERVNPQTVATSGPFSDPGLREVSPGVYDAYVLVQMWNFAPATMEVPVDSEVTFYLTSIDVQHGFKLWNTNGNIMVIPGEVSKVTINFDEPGEYIFVCHEYCGAAHAAMSGRIVVTEN
jgi:cytochrome c oxidase subunit 2